MSTITAPRTHAPAGDLASLPAAQRSEPTIGAVRVGVTGGLDARSAPRFDELVRSRTAERDVLAVVDVSGVEVLDRAGLLALDALRRGTATSRRHVVVRGVSAAADEVLRVDRRLRELRSGAGAVVAPRAVLAGTAPAHRAG